MFCISDLCSTSKGPLIDMLYSDSWLGYLSIAKLGFFWEICWVYMERTGKCICKNIRYITTSFDMMHEHKGFMNVSLKHSQYWSTISANCFHCIQSQLHVSFVNVFYGNLFYGYYPIPYLRNLNSDAALSTFLGPLNGPRNAIFDWVFKLNLWGNQRYNTGSTLKPNLNPNR